MEKKIRFLVREKRNPKEFTCKQFLLVKVKRFTPIHAYLELYYCVLLVPLLSPGNPRISEEWYTRVKVTWDPPQSHAVGYRIVYQPINGTHTGQIYSFYDNCIEKSTLYLKKKWRLCCSFIALSPCLNGNLKMHHIFSLMSCSN